VPRSLSPFSQERGDEAYLRECARPCSCIFCVGAGTCGVDKKDEKSPSSYEEDSRGISNLVAVVLALGILGVLGLLGLVVMGLIFLFQTAL
jgi:hypothetical protein